ncbi:hypothetical protein [Escherichia phage YX22]|uniref:Holin n=1 Tax=Escherichia phage YX22 TaxID=3093951 RepID=A0AAX4G8Y0_9CAUD|nr:hypothetical protein [Escherichia phage 2307YX22]
MATQTDTMIDVKAILTGVLTATIVSVGSVVWMMGKFENRLDVVERDSNKVDLILTKVNDMNEKIAVLNTDVNYVKQNVAELKLNSNSLSDDVRTLRITVADIQSNKGNGNGR